MSLNKTQRVVLFLIALIIIYVQLLVFDNEGIEGQGWILSVLISGGLIFLSLTGNIKFSQTKLAKIEETEIDNNTNQAQIVNFDNNEADLSTELSGNVEHLLGEIIAQSDIINVSSLEALTNDKDKAQQLSESMILNIKYACSGIVFGLMGMKMSSQQGFSYNSKHFKTLQNVARNQMIKCSVLALQKITGNIENIDVNENSSKLLEDIMQIRRAIGYYSSYNGNFEQKISKLTEWFFKNTGVKIEDISKLERIIN